MWKAASQLRLMASEEFGDAARNGNMEKGLEKKF
jgi:hypothetical protein